jgi:hypothetical protein
MVTVREVAVRSRRSSRWRVTVDSQALASSTDPTTPISTTATAAPRSASDLVLSTRSARSTRGDRPRTPVAVMGTVSTGLMGT